MKTFEDIYAENYARLHRLAQRMVDDRESASDIVQEVFVALYEKLSDGTAILYLNTWLYRVTLNKCNDQLKRMKKHRPLEEASEKMYEEAPSEHSERDRFVRQILSRMKPSERAILLLYGEGFSYKEIADTTGIRFTSVGKTLARSLKKMEELLKQHSYELH